MKILFLLFLLIGGFLLNIGLYYVNKDYRNFLHNLKYDDTEIVTVNDEYNIAPQNIESFNEELLLEKEIKNVTEENFLLSNDNQNIPTIEVDNTRVTNVVLGTKGKEKLQLFSQFSLLELQSHGSLFDVTTEYPDKYFEYYNEDMTLYIFPTKTYQQIKDILYVESNDAIFTLNETNNFGEQSFYINLGLAYDDGNVRMVILSKGITFGLKISKNQYNAVKQVLQQL